MEAGSTGPETDRKLKAMNTLRIAPQEIPAAPLARGALWPLRFPIVLVLARRRAEFVGGRKWERMLPFQLPPSILSKERFCGIRAIEARITRSLLCGGSGDIALRMRPAFPAPAKRFHQHDRGNQPLAADLNLGLLVVKQSLF